MTSYVTPKRGFPFICYVGLVSQSTGQFQSNPTLAAGDFKVSKDGGALNNLATLPAVTPAASKSVKISLDSDETNADNLVIIGSDAAGSEWDDLFINVQTTVQQIDDLASQASVNTLDDYVDTEIAAILTAVDTEVGAIKAKTDNLPSDPADESLLEAAIAGVQADTNDIQSRLPATLTANGLIKADTLRVGGTPQTPGDIILGTNDIQSRLPAALSGDGFIKADLKSIEDELTSGNNAILKLKGIDIQTAASNYPVNIVTPSIGGHAIHIEASGADAEAVYVFGEGYGIDIGANTGDAILVVSTLGKSINAPQNVAVSDGNLTLANIADSILKRDWTSVTGEAARSVLNALRKLRNKVSYSSPTLTVYKEDGVTSAYTQTVTSDSDQEPFKELGN